MSTVDGCTYPRLDSNQRLRHSERRALSPELRVLVVDRRGLEPRPSGLQSETVHQHPARTCAYPAGIRTRTVGVLNAVPLPLDHEGVPTRVDRGDRTRVFGLEDRREQPASPDPHSIRFGAILR